MLIVHASSSCDICLDAYDWDTPTQMPHAIPCGHIFCKTCLTLMGSSCPLCRKPFVARRIVKLHVDRPATSEQGVEDVELLQRLGAGEAKCQVELEAAVEQSKQRERALQELLERARRLRKRREEEAEARKQREKVAEARKQQPPTVAGNSASAGAAPSLTWTPSLRFFRDTYVIGTSATRWERGAGGGYIALANSTDAALSPTWTPSLRFFRDTYVIGTSATRWERGAGGGYIALANSTDAPHTSFTFGDFGDGNGFF